MGDAASAAQPPPAASPAFSYLAVFGNCPLIAAVLAFAIAQSIKVFTTWYAYLSRASPALPCHPAPAAGSELSVTGSVRACVGTRRTGGTRSSWWGPGGCRLRTRPPSPRSQSPSAYRKGSAARSSPQLPSLPLWLALFLS
uniref:Uncharacterized protein n=2 Tax=Aegilops tauschii subsp. strangulata TaxID=200361 RepID=A0A453S0U0_AEGTS